ALFSSILVLAFIPWLDTSRVRSARYRPLFKQFFWLWVIACIGLGWLGSKQPEGIYVILSRVFTVYYFAFFLIIMPLLGIFEKTKPLPNSISESVLGAKARAGHCHDRETHHSRSNAGERGRRADAARDR